MRKFCYKISLISGPTCLCSLTGNSILFSFKVSAESDVIGEDDPYPSDDEEEKENRVYMSSYHFNDSFVKRFYELTKKIQGWPKRLALGCVNLPLQKGETMDAGSRNLGQAFLTSLYRSRGCSRGRRARDSGSAATRRGPAIRAAGRRRRRSTLFPPSRLVLT